MGGGGPAGRGREREANSRLTPGPGPGSTVQPESNLEGPRPLAGEGEPGSSPDPAAPGEPGHPEPGSAPCSRRFFGARAAGLGGRPGGRVLKVPPRRRGEGGGGARSREGGASWRPRGRPGWGALRGPRWPRKAAPPPPAPPPPPPSTTGLSIAPSSHRAQEQLPGPDLWKRGAGEEEAPGPSARGEGKLPTPLPALHPGSPETPAPSTPQPGTWDPGRDRVRGQAGRMEPEPNPLPGGRLPGHVPVSQVGGSLPRGASRPQAPGRGAWQARVGSNGATSAVSPSPYDHPSVPPIHTPTHRHFPSQPSVQPDSGNFKLRELGPQTRPSLEPPGWAPAPKPARSPHLSQAALYRQGEEAGGAPLFPGDPRNEEVRGRGAGGRRGRQQDLLLGILGPLPLGDPVRCQVGLQALGRHYPPPTPPCLALT